MDESTLKLECLKLAAEATPHPDAGKMVKDAETLWQWVTLSGPCPAPRDSTADKS